MVNSQHSSKRVILNVPEGYQTDVRTPLLQEEETDSIEKKTKPEPASSSNKIGIAIMLFTTFLASVCFSIVLPSLPTFLEKGIGEKNSLWVGLAISVNSAGSFLASPIFGAWQDKRGTREVLGVTFILMVLGNVVYALSTTVWLLLVGRFVVGVAAANYAVAQTYLSYSTTDKNRTVVMAFNSAANVLGFIIGPAFALVLDLFHFEVAGIKVNPYTSPGYFSAILSLLGLFSLVVLKDIYSKKKTATKGFKAGGSGIMPGSQKFGGGSFYSAGGSVSDVSQIIKLGTQKDTGLPVGNIFICLWAYFAYTTSFTVFESIGTLYTQHAYNWGITDNSIMYAILGLICIFSLLFLQVFVRFFNDRILVLGGTVLTIMGFFILTKFGDGYVSFARFCIGVPLCSAGYATSVAVLISIYSKVLENFEQAMLMGWLSSVGSIARIIGPLFASDVLQYGGKPLHWNNGSLFVFLGTNLLIVVTFFVLLFSYKRLKPANENDIETLPVN